MLPVICSFFLALWTAASVWSISKYADRDWHRMTSAQQCSAGISIAFITILALYAAGWVFAPQAISYFVGENEVLTLRLDISATRN